MGKFKKIAIFVGCLMVLASVHAQDETLSGHERTIDGITFSGNGVLSFYESGKVKFGFLAHDEKINGIVFAAGSKIVFYASGKVNEGTFAKDTLVNGIEFMRGCDGTSFYESGRIKAGVLAKDTVINGIKFRAVRFEPRPNVMYFRKPDDATIFFYESGKVKQGVLAQGASIGGKQSRAGDMVEFDEQGNATKSGRRW